MTVWTDLTAMGWRTDTDLHKRQAVVDFQAMHNLDDPLRIDGDPGPATLAALKQSMDRRKAGLPDISENFNANEFACNCLKRRGTAYADCKRIWTPRSTVQLAEWWRTVIGPYSPVRAGRCPGENKAVGGVKNSYHLTGRGIDVPVFAVTVATALKRANGVGYYPYTVNGKTVWYVRHLDDRPNRVNPWAYPLSTRPSKVLTPRPDLAHKPTSPVTPATPTAPKPPTAPTTPAPTSEEDELMALMIQHPTDPKKKVGIASAIWSIWVYMLQARDLAKEARDNSAATLAIAKASAQSAQPLTAEETERIFRETITKIAAEGDVVDNALEGPA